MKKLNEPQPLNSVSEFHHTFKHPVEPAPLIPSDERCKLRVALLQEELKELEVAIADKDIVEVADALCDIQYVLSGAILEFGLGEKFKDLFDEVQRSNMSKACDSMQEAEQTMTFYKEKDGTDCYVKESDGKFLVYRKSDNKTMKSVNYSPADLKSILS